MRARNLYRYAHLLLLATAMPPANLAASTVVPANLRCEYMEEPLGIDAVRPRLSWLMDAGSDGSGDRGRRQTAYRVQVASRPELLEESKADLWDSGRVQSDQSIQVEYAGSPLASLQQCHWRVRLWDEKSEPSAWSEPASWSMGLLDPDDWQATWIRAGAVSRPPHDLEDCAWIWFAHDAGLEHTPPGPAFFRASLELPADAAVHRASVVMTADNAFTLFVNGKKALEGNEWKTLWRAEITDLLRPGKNVVAVMASNSDIGPNWAGLVGQLCVETGDGRQRMLDTGAAWKALDHEEAGWQEVAFDDAQWPGAREAGAFGIEPWGRLTGRENPAAPWLRKVFTIAAEPERAVATVNVLGYYELYVNGQKVGDDVLSPAVSDLGKRSFYRTHDIRHLLHAGQNCVGLWLDMGWYRQNPIARVQLDLTVDGTTAQVVSDRTWTSAPSNSTPLGSWSWGNMGGERIDARKDVPRWSEVECSEGDWVSVEEAPAPAGDVVAQPCPPNRIGAVIPLAACTARGPDTWELDFGTNLSGWMRLRFPRLDAGQRVVMTYSDKPGQTFNQADEFISAGKPGEQFCSRFNYHGFRYVMVEGLPEAPKAGDAEALLIESDLETVGDFACSNDLFNRIHKTNLWTLQCLNLGGYMVDCPHRERLGYGDGQVGVESLVMNRDAATFYAKWADDWLLAQNPDSGEIPYTAPRFCPSGGGPGWGGAGCVLPWKLYLHYGDRRVLERAREPIRRYVDFLESKCTDGVLRKYGGDWDFIGDWVPPGRGMDTDRWPSRAAAELFNNCYRLYLWELLARVNSVLERPDDNRRCRDRIAEIRPIVHAAFYETEKQLYVIDEQAYQLMPLMTGVVPEDLRETVWKRLEDGILEKGKGHLDTGMLGTYFLIQYLQENGRNDLLHTIFNQETYPGWGHMLAEGATTFWEQWNGYYSHIHSCFTSPGGWFFQGLAGIRPDATGPGFKKAIIRPAIVGDLKWAKAHHDSMHGRIVSEWELEGDRLKLLVTIPANTTATVFVPTRSTAAVTESGMPAAEARGVEFLREEGQSAVYAVGSGRYHFQSALPETCEVEMGKERGLGG